MVRPERLGPRVDPAARGTLARRLDLTRGEPFAVRRAGATAYVTWLPHKHLRRLTDLCGELTGREVAGDE